MLCFRVLRSNPADMHTVPGAPKINDRSMVVAVLENVLDQVENKAPRIALGDDADLDVRTIMFGPRTFEYSDYARMRRCKFNEIAAYDFGEEATIAVSLKQDSAVYMEAVQGLLHTMMVDGHNEHCYVIGPDTARRTEKVFVLSELRRLSMVKLVRTCGSGEGETHWGISAFGRSSIRMTFGFHNVEQMTAPLSWKARR